MSLNHQFADRGCLHKSIPFHFLAGYLRKPCFPVQQNRDLVDVVSGEQLVQVSLGSQGEKHASFLA